MKNIIILLSALFLTIGSTQAQLMGKGKVITREFDFKDFEKLSIQDFDGKIEVEIGKPYEVLIEIDENLEPRLRVNKDTGENQLNIFLEGNKNGKLYLEKTRIKIKVCMPSISFFEHRGNTVVVMNGIRGRFLRVDTVGNGNVFLQGEVEGLDIKKMGNGDIKANKLLTNVAKVKSYGNGNVIVNARISLEGHGAGKGSIMQAGTGKVEPMSGVIGNGDVRKI